MSIMRIMSIMQDSRAVDRPGNQTGGFFELCDTMFVKLCIRIYVHSMLYISHRTCASL